MCEAVRGMVQPQGSEAGIGFAEWKKPWEKMSEREKQREVLQRVKEKGPREIEVGSLEMQSR